MKSATAAEIKKELKQRSSVELVDVCLRLSALKKENKELLTYLLFDANNEDAFIESIKIEVDQMFCNTSTSNYYTARKNVRKILREVKTYIRFSKKKETEVELLIYFCGLMKEMRPSIRNCPVLDNLFKRQVLAVRKALQSLHEDLRFDYEQELNRISIHGSNT